MPKYPKARRSRQFLGSRALLGRGGTDARHRRRNHLVGARAGVALIFALSADRAGRCPPDAGLGEDGFSMDASIWVAAYDCAELERLLRD